LLSPILGRVHLRLSSRATPSFTTMSRIACMPVVTPT
jgi:hypothetical protein